MTKLLITIVFPMWALSAKEELSEFLFPLWPMYVLFAALVGVDLRLGTQAARFRGEVIRRSRAWRRTMSKYIDYCCVVTVCKMFDDFIVSWYSVPLVYISFCFVLAWVELDSIFSNFGELRGIDVLKVVKRFIYKKVVIDLPEKENRDADK
ncbi:MAG: phage holin family protein [Bacteroidaceae bacterium]|nr:phage holin family protein [Bacteroidaceae bacterium]